MTHKYFLLLNDLFEVTMLAKSFYKSDQFVVMSLCVVLKGNLRMKLKA